MQGFVIGMHRSGTSALTKVLGLLGFYLGEDSELLPADKDNVCGFFEYKKMKQFNDTALKRCNCEWYNITNFTTENQRFLQTEVFKENARALISDFIGYQNWIIKDPRLCLTLSFWQQQLPDSYVFYIHRNPQQIANSLLVRNGFPVEYGLALWEEYAMRAFEVIKPNTYIVQYEELIHNAESTVEKIRSQILQWDSSIKLESTESAISFIQRELQNQKQDNEIFEKFGTNSQIELHAAILSNDIDLVKNVVKKNRNINTEKLSLYANYYKQIVALVKQTGFSQTNAILTNIQSETPANTEILNAALEDTAADLRNFRKVLNKRTKQLTDVQEQLDKKTKEAQANEQRLQQQLQQLDKEKQSLTTQLQQATTAFGQNQELQKKVHSQQQEIQKLNFELTTLRTEQSALFTSFKQQLDIVESNRKQISELLTAISKNQQEKEEFNSSYMALVNENHKAALEYHKKIAELEQQKTLLEQQLLQQSTLLNEKEFVLMQKENQLKEKITIIDSLSSKIASLDFDIKLQIAKSDKLSLENEKQQTLISELQSVFEKLQSERNNDIVLINNFIKKINTEETINSVNDLIDYILSLLEKNKLQLQVSDNTISELTTEVAITKQQIRTKEQEYEFFQAVYEKKCSTLNILEKEYANILLRLNEHMQTVTEQSVNLQELSLQKEQLKTALQDSRNEVLLQINKTEELTKQKNNLAIEKDKLTKELSNLRLLKQEYTKLLEYIALKQNTSEQLANFANSAIAKAEYYVDLLHHSKKWHIGEATLKPLEYLLPKDKRISLPEVMQKDFATLKKEIHVLLKKSK